MLYPMQAAVLTGLNPRAILLALCTRVKTLNPKLNGVLDPLVKTGLKVQTINVV